MIEGSPRRGVLTNRNLLWDETWPLKQLLGLHDRRGPVIGSPRLRDYEKSCIRGTGSRASRLVRSSFLTKGEPLWYLLHERPHVLLQLDGSLGVYRRCIVELLAVTKDQFEIIDEELRRRVKATF